MSWKRVAELVLARANAAPEHAPIRSVRRLRATAREPSGTVTHRTARVRLR